VNDVAQTPAAAEPNPDAELIVAARNGDIPAFEKLVERYRGRVYSLALRMLQNPTDAEEVVQETFLSAFQNLPRFRGESQFGSWLHRICANFCLMRIRHRKVVDGATEPLGEPEFDDRGHMVIGEGVDWSARADDKIADAELHQAIEDAVARLPPEHRAVFLLKDTEGLSYEEIAETVGASVAAIKSRLHRARLALRQAIDEFFARER
jgi:RNA polymerase sigma-70 factor (ECF subfamily)